MKENLITKEFLSYYTKGNKANLDQRYLTSGSINTLINDGKEIKSREGYTLQSEAGISGNAVKGSWDWGDSIGNDFSLRSSGTILEVLINGTWETLMDSLTSIDMIFDTYWDNTEKIDRLIFCDGTPDLYDWSGAYTTLSSISATTVTTEGTDTFGQKKFLTTGTRGLRIKDDNGTWHEVNYTGGESTTTLTGLTVDLTSFPFSGGNLIVQKVVTHADTPDANFNVDFLMVLDNQIWAGSRTSNQAYVSKDTDIEDYTYSTPRAAGEGALLTLDSPGRAFGVLKGDAIIFTGKSYIYKSEFEQITVGSSLAETLKVKRLKTTARQSALHQRLVASEGNSLYFIGHDNVLYELLDASNADYPDIRPVSDPIKPDFDATDFTDGHVKSDKNRIYIAAPTSNVCYIREYRIEGEVKKWFWQPPQSLPVKRWAEIDDVIHGHSSVASETYKLFDGYNDNGFPMLARAVLAKWNGGERAMLKDASQIFHEGNIDAGTVIDVTNTFEVNDGVVEQDFRLIDGSRNTDTTQSYVYDMIEDPSLGINVLGEVSLSGDTIDDDDLPKFRVNHGFAPKSFYDYETQFETYGVDKRWRITATGCDAMLSTIKPSVQ